MPMSPVSSSSFGHSNDCFVGGGEMELSYRETTTISRRKTSSLNALQWVFSLRLSNRNRSPTLRMESSHVQHCRKDQEF